MYLYTTQKQIDRVAETWRRQYWREESGWDNAYLNKETIYNRLVALENPTDDDIAAVIGNRAWTRLTCDECSQEVGAIVSLGRNDFDAPSAAICKDCLVKALTLIED